jgi:hypothetical protein
MCIREMTHLLHSISRRSENCSIHVLPAFERVNQRTFNNKVYHFNTETEKVWANYSNCKFIKNPLISSSDKTLFPDGVHFSTSGMTRFVRIIKTHLDPILGMKPYSEYIHDRTRRRPNVNTWRTQGTKNRGHNQNRNRPSRASQLIQDLARLLN